MGITFKEFNEVLIDFGKNGTYKPQYEDQYGFLESYGYMNIDETTDGTDPKISLTILGIKHFNSLVKENEKLLEKELRCSDSEIDECILSIRHKGLFKQEFLRQYKCLKDKGYIKIYGDIDNLPADKNLYPQIVLTVSGVKKYNTLVSEDKQLMEIQLLPTIRFKKTGK